MNDRRIGIGLAAWFLGIIVPVYHHVGLHAALANERTLNAITRMRDVFVWLPWIDWIYLAVMVLAGTGLIVSGVRDRPARRAG